MLQEVLQPLSEDQIAGYRNMPANRWGTTVDFYQGGQLDTDVYDIAIVGVQEERGTENNVGCAAAPDLVRKELYNLVKYDARLRLVDMGNVKAGQNLTDTYFALSTVVDELLAGSVVPIIIGGSHDLTLAQYMGYGKSGKSVNLTVVDERIDLQDIDGPATDENFLAKIFAYEPNYLQHFVQLGYQSYFTDPKSFNTLDNLKFECVRLGDVRKNLEEVEPLVRDADLLSFDISSIKQADAPAHRDASPNGFYGEEACQIFRYAGMSDRLSSIGLYGLNPSFDRNRQTAQLAAQMVWYFVDGYYNRKRDYPFVDENDLLKYIVDFNEGEYELVFWKSKKSERWWLQVPGSGKQTRKLNAQMLVACSYNDYLQACQDELPDRWVKAYERLG